MSWIEQVNNKMVIVTGDGRTYTPFWFKATKTVEYNLAEYDFPEVEGTLVKRNKPRGAKYDLQIVFQGEEHLTEAKTFELSAKDSRPWTINHPLYGQIIVQPASLSFDNNSDNVSVITGTILETILDDNPRTIDDINSKLIADQAFANEDFYTSFDLTFKRSNESTALLGKNALFLYNEGRKVIDNDEDFDLFVNLYTQANSAILDNAGETLDMIQKVQNFINSSANLQLKVESRIQMLTNTFDGLSTLLTGKSEKVVYENNAGNILMAMAMSAATPLPGNYISRPQVISIIDILYAYFNLYITNLNTLSSDTNASTDSYLPDPISIFRLSALINYAIASLFQIAFGAKQERITYLTESSNLIVLTHRFLGLDPNDENLELFMNINEIGINEIIHIKKGRKIIYYI